MDKIDEILQTGSNVHDVYLSVGLDSYTDEWGGNPKPDEFYALPAQGRGHYQVWTKTWDGYGVPITQQTPLTVVNVTFSVN